MSKHCAFTLIVLIAFLLCTHIIYASNPSDIVPTTAAVVDLEVGEGISKGTAMALSDYLRTQVVNSNKFAIVTRENMEQILKEQQFQMSGCTSEECIVQIGKLLGARKMFAGSIGKVGTTYLITLRIIDVESSKIEKAETEQCTKCKEDSLVKSIKNIVDKIIQPNVEPRENQLGNLFDIDSYTKAIEKNPKNIAEYYEKRAVAYIMFQRYQDAISDYSKLIELTPKNFKHYVDRTWPYKLMGKYREAIADYTKAIELKPGDASLYDGRGGVYVDLGEYREAIENYSRAIKIDPKYFSTYRNRGYVYNKLGENQKAIGDYTKAINIFLESTETYLVKVFLTETYLRRGLIYNELGQNQEAMADYKKAGDNAIQYFLARADEKAGKPEAIEYAEKVLAIDSEDPFVYSKCGLIYEGLSQYQKAVELNSKAIVLGSKLPNPQLALAQFYLSRGTCYNYLNRYQEAVEDCSKAIEMDRTLGYAHFERGRTYSILKELNKAIIDFTNAIYYEPEHAYAYYFRGLSYMYLGGYQVSGCDDFYQAGLLFLKQNNRTKAVECVDLIKEADSSSTLIKKLMDKIYEEQ